MSFQQVNAKEINMNPFVTIGDQWTLITAGTKEKFNTMTASWGGFGVMWRKNAATIYIRPQRYTKEFVDKEETFTLSFFSENYRPALSLCGKVSGRDYDKVKESGLTPVYSEDGVYFEEADMVLVCKKMYQDEINSEKFHDSNMVSEHYPQNDFHVMYIAEIQKILIQTQ